MGEDRKGALGVEGHQEYGGGEWVPLDDYPGVLVQVANVRGRMTIVGVLVQRAEGVTLNDLREIPVHQLEAAANRELTAARVDSLSPEVQEKVVEVMQRTHGQLRESLSQRPDAPTRRALRLTLPKARKYPDSFYQRVAELYQALVANGRRPAPALADANSVPVTTVHRWIMEARARGLMAPARKAGATG